MPVPASNTTGTSLLNKTSGSWDPNVHTTCFREVHPTKTNGSLYVWLHFWMYFQPKGIQLIHWNSTNPIWNKLPKWWWLWDFLQEHTLDPSEHGNVGDTLLALGHFSKLQINYIMDGKTPKFTQTQFKNKPELLRQVLHKHSYNIPGSTLAQKEFSCFVHCTSDLSPGGTKPHTEPSAPTFWNLESTGILIWS